MCWDAFICSSRTNTAASSPEPLFRLTADFKEAFEEDEVVSNPVADIKSLEEELDEECARELAGAFLEDAATAVAGIDSAISAQNIADLKAHAHGLKGCCRTIKAPDAEQMCTDMESAAVNQDWNEIAALHPKLLGAYDELCSFIHSYLGSVQ